MLIITNYVSEALARNERHYRVQNYFDSRYDYRRTLRKPLTKTETLVPSGTTATFGV